MSIFGIDKNITCIDAPFDEETSEAIAIFQALLEVPKGRETWWRLKSFADIEETHRLLILCRTQKIRDCVEVIRGISKSDIQIYRDGADKRGFHHFELQVKDKYAMVYY